MKKNNQPKNLNLEPLAIAKFFYKKGINDLAIIQRLIYLTYLEVLKKENALLFAEEWQAWSGGPVIESVLYAMLKHFYKHGNNYDKFFQLVPSLKEQKIIKHCEKLIKHYQEYEKTNDQYKIYEETKTTPWKLARRNLADYLDKEKINLLDIVNYVRNTERIAI